MAKAAHKNKPAQQTKKAAAASEPLPRPMRESSTPWKRLRAFTQRCRRRASKTVRMAEVQFGSFFSAVQQHIMHLMVLISFNCAWLLSMFLRQVSVPFRCIVKCVLDVVSLIRSSLSRNVATSADEVFGARPLFCEDPNDETDSEERVAVRLYATRLTGDVDKIEKACKDAEEAGVVSFELDLARAEVRRQRALMPRTDVPTAEKGATLNRKSDELGEEMESEAAPQEASQEAKSPRQTRSHVLRRLVKAEQRGNTDRIERYIKSAMAVGLSTSEIEEARVAGRAQRIKAKEDKLTQSPKSCTQQSSSDGCDNIATKKYPVEGGQRLLLQDLISDTTRAPDPVEQLYVHIQNVHAKLHELQQHQQQQEQVQQQLQQQPQLQQQHQQLLVLKMLLQQQRQMYPQFLSTEPILVQNPDPRIVHVESQPEIAQHAADSVAGEHIAMKFVVVPPGGTMPAGALPVAVASTPEHLKAHVDYLHMAGAGLMSR
eukprot:TRINITY_DN12901_c0_g1_i1.p1 TRINITY_DN12901_c0_g1~~TRINITY_DN12901_c0_g1_i1.p1  ORF type:complete len:524 (-),score=97.22 TRINITY_DN12901_c0_g1_i1:153-1613(-)